MAGVVVHQHLEDTMLSSTVITRCVLFFYWGWSIVCNGSIDLASGTKKRQMIASCFKADIHHAEVLRLGIRKAGGLVSISLFISEVISWYLVNPDKWVILVGNEKHWTKIIEAGFVSMRDFTAGDLAVAFIISTANGCCYRNYIVSKREMINKDKLNRRKGRADMYGCHNI